MRRLYNLIAALVVIPFTVAQAHTGIKMRDVKRKIDTIFAPNRGEEMKAGSYRWLLPGYTQADTCLLVRRDGDYIDTFSYTFYLGFDDKREEHYKQSLPILAALFRIFMPSLQLTADQIQRNLQTAMNERKPITLTSDRLTVQISYFTPSPPEPDPYGYHGFCLEFAPAATHSKAKQ